MELRETPEIRSIAGCQSS